MDAISSSFMFQHPKRALLSPTNAPPSPKSPSLLNMSSVRIEESSQSISSAPTSITTNGPPMNNRPLEKNSISENTSEVTQTRPFPSTKITSITSSLQLQPSSFHKIFFNSIDDFINTFIDPPTRPSVDPRHILSKNFSPVLDELPPTECEVVEGSLPSDLNGAYIRNGPNPQFLPRGPYHLFDGDGMLHCIKIHQGKASLCSRFVRTYRYLTERDTGGPIIPNVFSGFNGLIASTARGILSAARIFTGQFNPSNGIGLANTNLALIGGKLFALGESDLPYKVTITPDGDVMTIGRHDFEGKLSTSMTAHPKTDAGTREIFAFRYGLTPPFLTYFMIKPDGEKQPDVPIFSMASPSFLHDFAITKKYAIFVETQLGMNPVEFIFGGSPVSADPAKIPRIGVIPKYAKDESEMRWFEVSGLNNVHTVNAWDEDDGDSIVMIVPNILSVEHTLERMELIHASMEKIKIDLKTGRVWRHPLSTRNLDFAVINPAYIGRKNKYVYAGIGDPLPKVVGVVKVDLSVAEGDRRDCIVASRIYGAGCYGGEPFFLPKSNNIDEDDGYLVSYVHNENNGESRFLVMDAKSPDLHIVAAVKLPRRVPYGLHGLFVRESDLNTL